MPRKPHPITVEEISGNEYPDLKAAQNAAIPDVANHLVSIMNRLIADGVLVRRGGKIVPNPDKH